MLGEPTRDRRAERRAATKAEILDAAWEQVRADGLAALSLRDLAKTVGMQPPSLYGYFDVEARDLRRDVRPGRAGVPRRASAARSPTIPASGWCRASATSCASARSTRPGTSCCSSARSRASSRRASRTRSPRPAWPSCASRLAAFGLTDPKLLDLYTALVTGLTDQQISNDPGGDRWIRLIDDAVTMFWDFVERQAVPADGGRQGATAGRAPTGKGTR